MYVTSNGLDRNRIGRVRPLPRSGPDPLLSVGGSRTAGLVRALQACALLVGCCILPQAGAQAHRVISPAVFPNGIPAAF